MPHTAPLVAHADRRAHRVAAELRSATTPAGIRAAMHALSALLFAAIRSTSDPPVPVVLLRGGLLMWDALRAARPDAPIGVLVPTRATGRPTVAYGNVPAARAYLLLDPIVNSGDTIVAAVGALRREAGPADVAVASVFATRAGVAAIHAAAPDVTVHTMWPDLAVGPDRRLVGVPFDAGDAACGTTGPRHHWR